MPDYDASNVALIEARIVHCPRGDDMDWDIGWYIFQHVLNWDIVSGVDINHR